MDQVGTQGKCDGIMRDKRAWKY